MFNLRSYLDFFRSEKNKAATTAANQLLTKNHNLPLSAFWEAITDKAFEEGPEVAMAVAKDPRCGINKNGSNDLPGLNIGPNNVIITPLVLAAFAGRADVVKALLAADATNLMYTFYIAATAGNTVAMNLLLINGADINAASSRGSTALHYAALNDQASAIKFLVEKGVDIDALDAEGVTALQRAINRRQFKAIHMLFAKGAALDAVNQNGETYLHVAARTGDVGMVEALAVHGSAMDAVDVFGYTPIHWAVRYDHVMVIKSLLANGANIDAADRLGNTPLHDAVTKRNVTTIELLVAEGADLSATNVVGSIPLALLHGTYLPHVQIERFRRLLKPKQIK